MKSNDVLKKVGKRVRALRLAKGIPSQMALANKAGLDRTYIGGIERGERNLALINLAKIARALNVSLAEFFTF